ncbi:MAG: hypothetical protein J7L07_10415 [Candidatus Odinarchaeota archaeon]|nr:hypothetical protein [Candidatus Odinarchaeota archaeon]
MKSITIKNIDEKLYQEFKAEAIRQGLRVSDAINEAMREWLIRRKRESKRKGKDRIWELIENPADWGIETDASKIDEELYGGE